MGRLFWKFFVALWLAQLATMAVVGLGIWWSRFASSPGTGDLRHLSRPMSEKAHLAVPQAPFNPRFVLSGTDRPFLRPPITPVLAGGLVSLIFASLLAWYFSRPIRGLHRAFEAVAGGRLETRIGDSMGRRRDELADLGSDFDCMASMLQAQIDSRQRLLHDVSHELRSPLARLQAVADLVRQQPGRASEFVDRIEIDLVRMDRLVGELLTLARIEVGVAEERDDDIELIEVIGDIAVDARFEIAGKQGEVVETVPDSLIVPGSRDLVYRAIENVVRNAVRYSPNGGTVTIAVRADESGKWVNIVVEDEGPGVAPDDQEAIWLPFFRCHPDASSVGHGLGLAITRRVIEAHGGRVSATTRATGGLRTTLQLPVQTGQVRQ